MNIRSLVTSFNSKSREEDRAWGVSYKKAAEAKPSWSKHGLPALFGEFVNLVNKAKLKGIHLDIGCGNGIKTVLFSKEGFDTVGIDQSDDGFDEAKEFSQELKIEKRCKFIEADCLKVPLKDDSVSSISDILMFTHLKPKYWKKYENELKRLLQSGGYMLFVLFSNKDEHFHGHAVSKRYHFKYDPHNPLMEGYEHYHGMYNTHFNKKDIDELFGDSFKIVKAVEVIHPLYKHRKLWNVIFQKKAND